jgi:hypothetical protein
MTLRSNPLYRNKPSSGRSVQGVEFIKESSGRPGGGVQHGNKVIALELSAIERKYAFHSISIPVFQGVILPLSTLRRSPHSDPRKTQGQDGFALSFRVGLLHPLQHAGLSRRSLHCRLV